AAATLRLRALRRRRTERIQTSHTTPATTPATASTTSTAVSSPGRAASQFTAARASTTAATADPVSPPPLLVFDERRRLAARRRVDARGRERPRAIPSSGGVGHRHPLSTIHLRHPRRW